MRATASIIPLDIRPQTGECYGRMPLTSEDRPLFARAYQEHYPALISFIRRRIQNDAEAADIAQEAYLRLLRYREDQDLSTLKALLFQITINLLTERARLARTQHWSEHVSLDSEPSIAEGAPSHDRRIDSERDLERLMAAIKKLPRKCQEVFVLRRFHGLGRQQIAHRLGISTKAVEKHITAAMTLLRKKLGGEQS